MMNLARDLHLNDLKLDDIKRALGLVEERSAAGDVLGRLSLFGAGVLLGAGLALLLTPLTGEEVREKLHESVDGLRGQRTDGPDAPSSS